MKVLIINSVFVVLDIYYYNVNLILNYTDMYYQCETKICYYCLKLEYKINCIPVCAEIYSITKNVLVVVRKSSLMNT